MVSQVSKALDLQRVGPGVSGQAGDKEGVELVRTYPHLLGEVELAEGDSVFDEQREVLGLYQQGLPAGRGEVNGRVWWSWGPALQWRETYVGTLPLSTGHQAWISQVLWVSLNTTHWPVFIP